MAPKRSLPPNMPPPRTPMLVRVRPRRQRMAPAAPAPAPVAPAPVAPAPAPTDPELPLNVVDLPEIIRAREQDWNRALVAPWIDQAPPRAPESNPANPAPGERGRRGWFSSVLALLLYSFWDYLLIVIIIVIMNPGSSLSWQPEKPYPIFFAIIGPNNRPGQCFFCARVVLSH
ncbi:hypothetical protein GCK72_021352 [Caenorhabditis remanei]|uniref:Uncharacterized protein n=1 Tax=Caenorhabditis remanei TaxID=31234 RepID=A0A6A5GHW8_CAERE|nr:hypothetical protein GCK72_021352 [Caenorhabditis remanei]KAF1754788.1 hypothetical protein GCK72_021352 [Caenorhabditis remanei]